MVIHDSLVACISMHDRTTHGTLFTLSEYSRFRATSCTLRSTTKPRTERYLTLFRHFRFRATSCTLRSTTKPRTERYLPFPNIHDFVQQVARYDPRPNHARNEIKCGDFCVCFFKQRIINHQERYSFRATSCTLRFTISCNELHATGIILDINFVF